MLDQFRILVIFISRTEGSIPTNDTEVKRCFCCPQALHSPQHCANLIEGAKKLLAPPPPPPLTLVSVAWEINVFDQHGQILSPFSKIQIWFIFWFF